MVPVEVPPLRLNTTVAPPVVRLFPAASRACKVRVTVLPDCTVAEETETMDVAELIAPGVTVMVGMVVVTGVPPMVAAMVVAVPATRPVKVAE